MTVFCIYMHIHCMSNHSLVCLPIILSVCPSFCPSVYPSVHPYLCSHIVKIAKSIEKLRKINLKSMVQSMESNHPWKEKNIEKKIALKSRIVVRTNLFPRDWDAFCTVLMQAFWNLKLHFKTLLNFNNRLLSCILCPIFFVFGSVLICLVCRLSRLTPLPELQV